MSVRPLRVTTCPTVTDISGPALATGTAGATLLQTRAASALTPMCRFLVSITHAKDKRIYTWPWIQPPHNGFI